MTSSDLQYSAISKMKDIDAPILVCLFAFLMAMIYGAYTVDEKIYEEVVLPVWPMASTGVPMERWGSGIR